MNEQLKPCPFCGADGYLSELDGYRPSSPKTYQAMCSNDDCNIQGLEFDAEGEGNPPSSILPQYFTEEELDEFLVQSGLIDKLLSQLDAAPRNANWEDELNELEIELVRQGWK